MIPYRTIRGTKMTPREFLDELAYPVSSGSTLITIITFVLLIWLVGAAGIFGIWLAVAVVPAFLRYLTMVAEARAQGRDAEPPGIEYFTLVGNAWTLFPVIPAFIMASLVGVAQETWGSVPAMILAVAFSVPFPAFLAVLVITHSPLQSVDPRALYRFIRHCNKSYWYAPAAAILVIVLPTLLASLPHLPLNFVKVYLLVAFFGVTGAVTRGTKLFTEVELPEAAGVDEEKLRRGLARKRNQILDHAYGFVSRGNRDGGMAHIFRWLDQDPEPDDAWPWYFEQMLRWENPYPGLLLAQQYVGRLLETGDQVGAVKLILRCRLMDEAFRPLGTDLPRAIAAAQACKNSELAEALSRRG
jgi:hypothetical protein